MSSSGSWKYVRKLFAGIAVAMFRISVSQLPAATATGVQDVLNENQSVAPFVVWQVSASAGGSCPADAKTRRMPRLPRLIRSSRKPAQVFPLPRVSFADVVAPTASVGRAARAGAGPVVTTSAITRTTTRVRYSEARGMYGA
jgi:hypothetical protein